MWVSAASRERSRATDRTRRGSFRHCRSLFIQAVLRRDSLQEKSGMLVLSRKKSEKIKLGDSIEITIVRVCGNKVRLGIQAPSDVAVLRRELSKEGAPPPGS